MIFNKNLKNIFLVVFTTLILSACSTAKKSGDLDGDVYTGKETVKYLASGVPDRVFFATNKSSLTTASRATLRKQATYLRKNPKLNVTIEGHADEIRVLFPDHTWQDAAHLRARARCSTRYLAHAR